MLLVETTIMPSREIVEHVHEGNERIVRTGVRAEVLVHLSIGEVLGAHVIEMV